MQHQYNKSHIGETYISNEGYKLTIVGSGTRNHYCVVDIAGRYTVEAQYHKVKDGGIKNVYHRAVYGVGYLGLGDYSPKGNKVHRQIYDLWNKMLERVYSPSKLEKCPSYKGTTVCKEWHNFQVFAKWFEENHVEGWQLDKDLLSKGTKIYSPETCVFIPRELNTFMTNVKVDNTSGYTGVSYSKPNGKWVANISIGGKRKYLGQRDSVEEAYKLYKKARDKICQEWRIKMKGKISDAAIAAIK